jgi:hypothetical protein
MLLTVVELMELSFMLSGTARGNQFRGVAEPHADGIK